MRRIYLDNNATTRVAPAVLAGMLPWLGERFGNPSSLHPRGRAAADALRAARGAVARLAGAEPGEVVFTAGGSESVAIAFAAAGAPRPGRRRVVVSAVEHAAVHANARRAAEAGAELVVVGVDGEGRLDRERLLAAIDGETLLVSLIAANNETGVVSDLAGIGAACRAAGALFHVDAIQVPGKLPLDARALGADLLSLSAHKFHGPPGVGALVVRRGLALRPLTVGGPQEAGRRAGTENVPGIVGMGIAATLARAQAADERAAERLARLRDRLERGIRERIGGTRAHGAGAPRVPNTTDVGFEGLEATSLLALLAEHGVDASAGSACHAGRSGPSPVLLAMGRGPAEAAGSIRFSLSCETTAEDVERAIAAVEASVATLRQLA